MKVGVEKSAEKYQFMTNRFPASNVPVFVCLIQLQFYFTHKNNVRCKFYALHIDVTLYHYIISYLFLCIRMCPFFIFGLWSHLLSGLLRIGNYCQNYFTVTLALIRKLRQKSESIHITSEANSAFSHLLNGSSHPSCKLVTSVRKACSCIFSLSESSIKRGLH